MYKIFIKMYVLFVCSVQYDYCTLCQGGGGERERRAGGGWFCTVKIITVQCTGLAGLDRWGGQSWGERRIQLWGEKRNQSWGGGVHDVRCTHTMYCTNNFNLLSPPPWPRPPPSITPRFVQFSHLFSTDFTFI